MNKRDTGFAAGYKAAKDSVERYTPTDDPSGYDLSGSEAAEALGLDVQTDEHAAGFADGWNAYLATEL